MAPIRTSATRRCCGRCRVGSAFWWRALKKVTCSHSIRIITVSCSGASKAMLGEGEAVSCVGGGADEQNAYYGFVSGGMAAIKLANGERAWFTPIAGEGARTGHGAAATVIPGAVFAGGSDGKLTALSTVDGKK